MKLEDVANAYGTHPESMGTITITNTSLGTEGVSIAGTPTGPIIGVAILLGIDQILDMGRTTVNLIGNCVATVAMACWENEFDYNKMNEFIKLKVIRTNTLKKIKSDVSYQKDFAE